MTGFINITNMTDILLASIFILFVVQVVTILKMVNIIKQLNKLFFEVRMLFKNSGIFYQPQKNKVVKFNSCQYCKFRMSFIQITEEENKDNFYYKCKKHDIEIELIDSCKQFERDYKQD
jgi:hypothetical protein